MQRRRSRHQSGGRSGCLRPVPCQWRADRASALSPCRSARRHRVTVTGGPRSRCPPPPAGGSAAQASPGLWPPLRRSSVPVLGRSGGRRSSQAAPCRDVSSSTSSPSESESSSTGNACRARRPRRRRSRSRRPGSALLNPAGNAFRRGPSRDLQSHESRYGGPVTSRLRRRRSSADRSRRWLQDFLLRCYYIR